MVSMVTSENLNEKHMPEILEGAEARTQKSSRSCGCGSDFSMDQLSTGKGTEWFAFDS